MYCRFSFESKFLLYTNFAPKKKIDFFQIMSEKLPKLAKNTREDPYHFKYPKISKNIYFSETDMDMDI